MAGLRLLLVVAALLAGALVAACNGDEENGDEDGAAEQPTATATVEDQDADEGDGDGDETGADLSEQLRGLAEQFAVREAKVTYDMSSTDNGDTQEGSVTLYRKPPDASRVDFSLDGEEASLISTSDASYICAELDGEGQCLQSPIGQVAPLPFLRAFTEPDGLIDFIDASIPRLDIDRSDRTIAGRDAACFSSSGTVDGETGFAEWCFSDDGILLLLRVGGGGAGTAGDFRLEATDVDDEVDEADLEPPYEVTDIPGAP